MFFFLFGSKAAHGRKDPINDTLNSESVFYVYIERKRAKWVNLLVIEGREKKIEYIYMNENAAKYVLHAVYGSVWAVSLFFYAFIKWNIVLIGSNKYGENAHKVHVLSVLLHSNANSLLLA